MPVVIHACLELIAPNDETRGMLPSMPIYEYFCEPCEKVFEQLKPMSQATVPTPCPACSTTAERLPPSGVGLFTMRDGYPRRVPDSGQPYGPVGEFTTGATPEMKAKAMLAERRLRKEAGFPDPA